MKTKYKTLTLHFVLLVMLVACKKEITINYPQAIRFSSLICSNPTNNIDTIRLMMIGTYNWVKTAVSSREGVNYTDPYTEHLTYKYIFRPDSIVELYENNKLKWSNKYVVDYEMPVIILPSAGTIVSIIDKTTNNRIEYFYPYLCNDSAMFNKPGSIDVIRYFARQ